MIGTPELLIIGGIVLLIFGATAIPKLARSIARARQEFRKGLQETDGSEPEEHKAEDGEGEAEPPGQ